MCVGNDIAVRTNQNLICENLLPSRDLLLQTKVVDTVIRFVLCLCISDADSLINNPYCTRLVAIFGDSSTLGMRQLHIYCTFIVQLINFRYAIFN